MRRGKLSIALAVILTTLAAGFLMTGPRAVAQQETLLYKFGDPENGHWPLGGVIFDKAGNLYGATDGGGAYQRGAVFELTPTSDGGWSEKVLYSFGHVETDGFNPGGNLILDASGNLYHGRCRASRGGRPGRQSHMVPP